MDAFEWHQHCWDGTQHVVQHPHLSPWKFLKELGRRASLPPQISSTNKKMRKVGMGKLFGKKMNVNFEIASNFRNMSNDISKEPTCWLQPHNGTHMRICPRCFTIDCVAMAQSQ